MSDWLGVIEGVVTAAIPVIGLVYTYNAKVRGQYDQVLAITQQATVPPVADDRHVAGTAFEPLVLQPHLVIFESLSLVVEVAGTFLVVVAPS